MAAFKREDVRLSWILPMGKVRTLPLSSQTCASNGWWVWHICQYQPFGRRYRLFPSAKTRGRWKVRM